MKNFRIILTVGIIFLINFVSVAQKRIIQNLRYEDDFSYLKNDTIKKKGVEKLKFVPLSKSKKVHVSFGGEIREWYEYRGNINFGDLPPGMQPDKDGALLHRFMFHSDLWLGKRLRLFAQLNNTLQLGSPNEPIPEISQDGLGLHQTFLETHFGERDKQDKFILRLGRQEYNFGNEMIISSREGPNNRLSFDGVSFIINNNKNQIHLFGATPVIINKDVFDNKHIDEYVWGAYSYLRKTKNTKVDAYYIGFNTDRRVFNFVSGKQTRHTLGTRIWNHKRPVHYDFETMYQFGKFNELNINAYNARGLIRYYFKGKLKPMIGLGASYISGDKSPTDNQLNTYDPLYPRPTFGLGAPLGPANITSIRPVFGITPNNKLFINGSIYFLARNSINDGTYTPSMVQVRPFPPFVSNEKSIGTQYSLDAFYFPNKHWTFILFSSIVTPGSYVKETGQGQNIFYFALSGAYKF